MRFIALGMIITSLLATPASAQYAGPSTGPSREGFWIGFGWGLGQISFGADASSADPETALSGHFRLGGTVNKQWRLGAETNGWVGDVNGADAQFGTLMGTATLYPTPAGNFFLKGGLGVGRYIETFAGDEGTASGSAIQLGVGYDIRMQGKFGLTLVANYIATSGWGYEFNGSPVGADVDPSLIQVGIGVVWH